MLAEGFLRMLHYREERKFASASKHHKAQAHARRTDPVLSNSTETVSAETGPNQEELDSTYSNGLRALPQGAVGLSIPGCSPPLVDPDFGVCLDSCSLLYQYPDLQVADSGLISQNIRRPAAPQHRSATHPDASEARAAKQELRNEPLSSIADQVYVVQEPDANTSLDLPGSGLEPMSNSLLNGMLDKQLEEVYLQHLTDNLARCNSNLGNSLLHGLVPPPQPSSQPHGLVSLEASLEEGESSKKMSYLNTQNLPPCSSNFSSPVLRISEALE